tara:strand:+ start:275 stop:1096 length:822 start_codon:yes stop_codon:yes gene_type:complete
MWKLKYSFLDNNTNNLESFTDHGKTAEWEKRKNWFKNSSGPFKKCIELKGILGKPNYVSYSDKGMVEYVKWQKELDTNNFQYGALNGVDMIKITNYVPKKTHPYMASVYVIVGKFIHVPNHLIGPLKYASETINIEQLSVPRKDNDEFVKTGKKPKVLLTGSCASITISSITIKFAEDMIAIDKDLTLEDVNEDTYKTYREEYGRRISDYLCGKGITDPIEWFKPENFKEKALIDSIPACPSKNTETFYNPKLNSKLNSETPKMKQVNYKKNK